MKSIKLSHGIYVKINEKYEDFKLRKELCIMSMNKDNEDVFRKLETEEAVKDDSSRARITRDLSGYTWLMERMRPGQGEAEGIHLLRAELCGNIARWNGARVPGDVYSDLYNAGEIPDPYVGRNMALVKWVQDYEWWYTDSFNASEDMKGKDIALVFEGVDYECDVWMNGTHLGHHEGMNSSFKYDITELIDWSSVSTACNIIMIKLAPAPKNQTNFAGLKNNFSGDYLPGISQVGIWKPIKLVATEKVRIENYRVESKVKDNYVDATVEVEIEGLSDTTIDSNVVVELEDADGNVFSEEKSLTVNKGSNTVEVAFGIENPKLWWPYELGAQNRYDIRVTVTTKEKELDFVSGKVGLREVTMQMNPGFTAEEAELPWTFVINGKPMFLRSACWSAQPSFLYGRNSREKYRHFLEKAKECNINNLRMFGWHPAEVEDFYDICDELGITVWTNFAFATLVFRDDEEYLEKVYAEVAEIVKDRRNHPSTVMWMGGEEVYFSKAHIESNNKNLMVKLGEITNSLSNTPYADASPLSSREGILMGYKPKESFHANSHCYAAGGIFMEDYYPTLDYCIIPELTAYSAPNVESLKKFIPEDELWPMGYSWGYHGAVIHNLQILNYEVFGDTCMDSLEHFVEATQIAQGVIFQYSLEHYRRCKPHISGVALCHFNTHWPLIKWEIIDYYGVEKKSFDYVKKSYQPLLPTMQYPKRRYLPGEQFQANMWVVNDYYEAYQDVVYTCDIYDQNDVKLASFDKVINIGENESVEHFAIDWMVEGSEGDVFKVKVQLADKEGIILSDNEYFVLILDQDKAKLEAYNMYLNMKAGKTKYGRKSYYQFAPELLVED